ncbi:hypothetical protein H78_03714 [Pseudomonas protegens]|uniref:hypothetical protein n=1 Tax=Pseudomonas protegens TaxID=380021 RepID=UPI0009C20CBE|nr:hypothetical protein [Pseudomonas protegens]AQT10378.1 hypothetical protein H78_03714 [Pseudomonas protegens]GED73268.1 hypothetical protein PFL02_01180 [Pseudomonas fluorescens]
MSITVKNNTSNIIEVAINQWDTDGDTRYSPLSVGASDKWVRKDTRGYVLSLRQRGVEKPYYVLVDSNIVVDNTEVKDNEKVISPISR